MDKIKYLGVTIDARLSFKEHLLNVGLKASKVARALAGIMLNIEGPKHPIWSDALNKYTTYGAIIPVNMERTFDTRGHGTLPALVTDGLGCGCDSRDFHRRAAELYQEERRKKREGTS